MEREYVVTVIQGVDWQEVHKDIVNDTFSNNSVDSNIVPDRPCPCVKERPLNKRNTHYLLTDEEAKNLRNDSRVSGVEAIESIPEPEPQVVQDGAFNRSTASSGQQDNWGLIRHTAESNVYGGSFLDPGLSYEYVLDGSGVDLVIMDTGIQADHPEWENEFGTSRLIQLDWYEASGVPGTLPAEFYTDTNGHGTHCVGTMGGKTFGWAKNALIFNLTTYGNPGNSISFEDAVDCLIGWHNGKPVNPATGFKRPTVVNMSFQYSWYLDTSVTPNEISFTSTGAGYGVTGGRYRGASHSENNRANLMEKGVLGSNRGKYLFGRKITSKDADVEQLVANGIHVCTAAGNNYMKIDLPGNSDYNNYLTANISGSNHYFYYHRGASPSVFEGGDTYANTNSQDFVYNHPGSVVSPVGAPSLNDGFDVGAIDNSSTYHSGAYADKKASFSDSGPGVGIYAVGDQVVSAQPNNQGSPYYLDPGYKQDKYSGTSMAAPQVCGIMACILQAHPDWTPKQLKNYILSNSQSLLYDTGNNNDYTDNASIHGGNNRIAYLPMNGSKTFAYGTAE